MQEVKLAPVYSNTKNAIGRPVRSFSKAYTMANPPRQEGVIKALDLYSGCGGFSTALKRISKAKGFRVSLTVLNHWDAALETARLNLGDV